MTQKINLVKVINFRPIFYSFLAFLFGILCTRGIFAGEALYVSLVCVFFVLLTVLCLIYKKWAAVLLVIISFFAGFGAYFAGYKIFMGEKYQGRQDVIARVSDKISESDYYYSVVLDDCYVGGKKSKNISLSIRKNAEITIESGDILSFNAYVDHVHIFTLNKFNNYNLRNRTAYESSVNLSDVTLMSGKLKLDEKIRFKIKRILYQNMDEDTASVAFAMLVGDKSSIDEEIKDDYAGAGIIHILTVSGLHITFLIGVISFILKKCRVNKYVNFFVIFAFLIFYCFICGFTPSVLRASIMGLVFILARLFAKEYDNLTTLSVAGFIVLFISPLYAFDVGFLMSFSCVLMIFLLAKPLQRVFSKFLPKYFASAIAVSISAEIGILPFLASFGQSFNLLSIILNLFVIPLFEFLYILLFVSIIIALIPFMGWALKPSQYIIYGINYVANLFASTKAKVNLKQFNILILSLYILIMFTLSGFVMARKKTKALIVSIMICIMSSFLLVDNLSRTTFSTSAYSITYYGDESVFLTSKSGEVAFIGRGVSSLDQRFLNVNNITKIDYAFLVDVNEEDLLEVRNSVKEINSEKIVVCKVEIFRDDEIVAKENEADFAGNFCFEYIYNSSTQLGLKIDFDNLSIFFASKGNLSYNNLVKLDEEVKTHAFDAVFLGRRYYSANLFSNSLLKFGIYEDESIDYSFIDYGNMQIDFENKIIRSLD